MDASTRRQRRRVLAAAGASLLLPAARAQADFLRGPLRLIVALPPGGAADVSTRTYAPLLEKALGQPVVVDNRPGGQFQIAMQALMSAPADGHTLLHVFNSFASVHAVQKLFDLEKQVAPVAVMGLTPIIGVVRGDSPHRTLADVFGWARANPGKLTYSTLGPGSVEHLKMAQIETAAGFRGVPVPYRGGPDALKGLIGGEIDFQFTAGIFGKQFAPSGQIRVVGTMDPVRWRDFPDAPTLGESGVAVPPMTYWGGFVARAGTPPEIVQRLNRDLNALGQVPAVVERLAAAGTVPAPSRSPDEFRQLITSEIAWMTDAARGLKLI